MSDRRWPIRGVAGVVVVAGLAIAAPGASQTLELLEAGRAAANRGDHAEAFACFRAAYQPLEDHPMALVGMALQTGAVVLRRTR